MNKDVGGSWPLQEGGTGSPGREDTCPGLSSRTGGGRKRTSQLREERLGPHTPTLLGLRKTQGQNVRLRGWQEAVRGGGSGSVATSPAPLLLAPRCLRTPFLHLSKPVLFPVLQTPNSSCLMTSRPPREITGKCTTHVYAHPRHSAPGTVAGPQAAQGKHCGDLSLLTGSSYGGPAECVS